MVFKILAALAGIALVISTLLTAYYGRRCAQRKRENFLETLDKHEKAAKALFWVTSGAIIAIELMIRFHGGIHFHILFPIHLLFAIPFFLTMVAMRFWVNGLRRPLVHRLLARVCLAAFVGTIVTGTILFLRL